MNLDDLLEMSSRIERCFLADVGVRVGETTVASRKVHMIDPRRPDETKISCTKDAGQVFYGRQGLNEVVHMDIFHELADVDHYAVAKAIKDSVYEFSSTLGQMPAMTRNWPPGADGLADMIDVQTATGGGRVTGQLKYGRKWSLRTAHRGHVHVAAMIPDSMLGLIYYIVRDVEKAIMHQGVEIRKVGRIINDRSVGGANLDLSSYTSQTDSMLKGEGSSGHSGQDSMMKQALDACEDFGSAPAFQAFLDSLGSVRRRESPYTFLERELGDAEAVLSKLRAMDIIEGDGAGLRLTEKGRRLSDYLRKFCREVEVEMRKIIRRTPRSEASWTDRVDFRKPKAAKACARKSRVSVHSDETDRRGTIAVPDTVCAWATRCAVQGGRTGLVRDDVRFQITRRRPKVDICLLIDASASMAGRRIQAAKYLARHLFLKSRDKVSVVTFQDRHALAHVIRARSHRSLEAGLSTVRPAGLTPLATGIVEAVKLLGRRKKSPTLLVLLTDGIPTMNQWTGDPAGDALVAAEKIAQRKIPFTCIGLSPNKSFLRRLTQTARGTLYIVDEFDRDVLARLVCDERDRVPAGE